MKQDPVITVAYADDHISIRQGIISYLKGLGGVDVIIEANNGLELINALNNAQALPDVILLDINMPVMDGFETMSSLKEKWPDIKTLVLTGFETELYLIRMIKMGANGYLLKSCHPQEIKHALTSIYKNNYYYYDSQSKSFHNKVIKEVIKLPNLTENETQFLKYCPTDLSYNQIALKMNTTIKSIDGYRDRLCEKLQIKGRIGLALWAVQYGLVMIESRINTEK